MSGKRAMTPTMVSLLKEFGPLDGQKIDGGCDHCDAYQTFEPVQAGCWKITVHHEDWCPILSRGEEAS